MESCRLQQLEELECMLSMFPTAEELEVSDALRSEVEAQLPGNGTPVRYAVRIQGVSDREVPTLELAYPASYPKEPLAFQVHCSWLNRADKEALQSQLTALAVDAARRSEVVALELYQSMRECLENARDNEISERAEAISTSSATEPSAPSEDVVLGRRAIYFHHIIAQTKRRVIVDWAVELELSGMSKIGWPGVVIVEGNEQNVQEYVRRLQHLRWKQMTVRGEQIERSSGSQTIDQMRKLPRGFREFPEKSGMAEVAAACREAGVEELFLTTMKIYGRSEGVDEGEHHKDDQQTTISKKPKERQL